MTTYRVDFGHCDGYTDHMDIEASTHDSFLPVLVESLSKAYRGKASVTNTETLQVKYFSVDSPISRHFEARIIEIIPGTEEYYN